ncbi:hypothetical protein [uncultured Treponema sp.]|uniref:hypothetical protein n=1 Tax=uncultured Treponema sp. TaxID=162155 RepID=UPI0025D4DAA3|nr:hypothetical protein [uncultured Treponema sp.]
MKTKFKFTLCVFFVLLAAIFQVSGLTMSARAILTGNLVKESQGKDEDAKYEFFKLDPKNQKDDDGLVIEFSEGSFGGRLGLWYQVNNKIQADGATVSFRRSNVWFKPFETLKLTLGYVGNDQLYKERIDDWKVGNPFSLNEREWGAHPGYVNNSDVDDMGIGFESRAIEGLILTGGIARRWGGSYGPGEFGKAFWSKDEDGDPVYGAWGLTARYYPGNDICFQAAYRDNGTRDWKVARCAVGYEANGIYAFVQPCFGIDWNGDENKYELSGICFDLYGEYKFDAWTILAHVPVTVRLTDKDDDPSYLEASCQVKYNLGKIGNMDDFSPNIRFGSQVHDGDNLYPYIQLSDDFSDSLNFDITPGLEFKVGSCEVSFGFEMMFHSKLYTDAKLTNDFEWKVPFTTEIKL